MHTPAKQQFLCKCNENCRRHTLCLARQFEAVSCQNNAFLQAMFYCAEHPNIHPFFCEIRQIIVKPLEKLYQFW